MMVTSIPVGRKTLRAGTTSWFGGGEVYMEYALVSTP